MKSSLLLLASSFLLSYASPDHGGSHGSHQGASHGSHHAPSHAFQHRGSQGPRQGRVLPASLAPAPTQNIAELATATPQLSTLLAAVKAAGLVDTLASEGPFTVFAPTNSAFAKLPSGTLEDLLADKAALTAVLLRHVVPGSALRAGEVPEGSTTLATAGGEEITVTRGAYLRVRSAGAETGVAVFDILATNGVIHLVNNVI